MICRLCKRDSGEAEFCEACLDRVKALLAKPLATPVSKPDTRRYFLVTGLAKFTTVVDTAHTASDAQHTAVTDPLQPWYLEGNVIDMTEGVGGVEEISHDQYCKWLRSSEASTTKNST